MRERKRKEKTDSFLLPSYGKNTCLSLLITRGYGEKEIGFPFQKFLVTNGRETRYRMFLGKKGFFYLVPKIRTAPLPLFIMTWKKGTGAINQVAWLGWGGIDLISFHSPPFPFLRTREPGQQSGFFSQDVYMRESKVPVHIFFL